MSATTVHFKLPSLTSPSAFTRFSLSADSSSTLLRLLNDKLESLNRSPSSLCYVDADGDLCQLRTAEDLTTAIDHLHGTAVMLNTGEEGEEEGIEIIHDRPRARSHSRRRSRSHSRGRLSRSRSQGARKDRSSSSSSSSSSSTSASSDSDVMVVENGDQPCKMKRMKKFRKMMKKHMKGKRKMMKKLHAHHRHGFKHGHHSPPPFGRHGFGFHRSPRTDDSFFYPPPPPFSDRHHGPFNGKHHFRSFEERCPRRGDMFCSFRRRHPFEGPFGEEHRGFGPFGRHRGGLGFGGRGGFGHFGHRGGFDFEGRGGFGSFGGPHLRRRHNSE